METAAYLEWEKTQIAEASELMDRIYDTALGGAGCCLHVVTDDQNLKDSDIDWVLDNVVFRVGHPMCIELAQRLRVLNYEQRCKAIRWDPKDEQTSPRPAHTVHDLGSPELWGVGSPTCRRCLVMFDPHDDLSRYTPGSVGHSCIEVRST